MSVQYCPLCVWIVKCPLSIGAAGWEACPVCCKDKSSASVFQPKCSGCGTICLSSAAWAGSRWGWEPSLIIVMALLQQRLVHVSCSQDRSVPTQRSAAPTPLCKAFRSPVQLTKQEKLRWSVCSPQRPSPGCSGSWERPWTFSAVSAGRAAVLPYLSERVCGWTRRSPQGDNLGGTWCYPLELCWWGEERGSAAACWARPPQTFKLKKRTVWCFFFCFCTRIYFW